MRLRKMLDLPKAPSLKILIVIMLALPFPIFGANATPRCVKKLAVTFYDGVYLDQALNMHKVGQSSWNLIKSELSRRSKEVPNLMYAEGKKQRPNPLDHPFQAKEAEKLFLKVLYKIFEETLNNFDVMNRSGNRDMFEYIKFHQQPKIDACLYN
jgi:hypothetical protein